MPKQWSIKLLWKVSNNIMKPSVIKLKWINKVFLKD